MGRRKNREKKYMYSRNRIALIKSSGEEISLEEWLEIRNKSPICKRCKRFVGCNNLTMDHIVSLSKRWPNTTFPILKLYADTAILQKGIKFRNG